MMPSWNVSAIRATLPGFPYTVRTGRHVKRRNRNPLLITAVATALVLTLPALASVLIRARWAAHAVSTIG